MRGYSQEHKHDKTMRKLTGETLILQNILVDLAISDMLDETLKDLLGKDSGARVNAE
jgi:hypothetical protein